MTAATPALRVTGRWLADLRGHVHVTLKDWADAQDLLARYETGGLTVTQAEPGPEPVGVGCDGCGAVGPLVTAPGTSGQSWQCQCGTVWSQSGPGLRAVEEGR